VPNAVLDVTNSRADEALVQMLDRYAETTLQWAPSRPTLSGRVREQLVAALSSGAPTAVQVSVALNMSVRTLHRGLRQENTSYRVLLEQLRQERAAELLSSRRCSIAEVAFLIGYSELSGFYRAFKRWTGMTPAEFQAQAGAAPTSSP
jgi:AraC-like DNA-binding protein